MALAEPFSSLNSSPKRIALLDAHTVNQIAAGEVIERPAAALKELLENSLDAGATRIDVELHNAGRTRIRIRDDGAGMSPEEAELALQRHATSKIQGVDDLLSVQTLGFRGEALPSIASVSRMTILTSSQPGSRTHLRVVAGTIERLADEPGPKGTEITVEDLFFNTPARLKFLKSDTTELGASLEAVSRYAIAFPDVAFSFRHNGQEVFRTNGRGDRLEAIADVWGRDMARSLAEVDTEAAGIRVRGFVSPPHLTRPTRAYQYIFVNGRPVRTRTLTVALDLAYRDFLPERRFPVLALMLEIDPSRVDVNVSPTKSEVKFQHEGQAFDALRVAIKSALLDHGMIPDAANLAAANSALEAARPTSGYLGSPLWALGAAEQSPSNLPPLESPPEPAMGAGSVEGFNVSGASRHLPFGDLLDGLRVIGQAMDTFIIAETLKGLVIIDQHVAHERILYEYLCGMRGAAAIERQPLLVPETLHLDKRAALLLRDQLGELSRIGFDLEPFGGETYVVRGVPGAMRGKSATKILRDLIDELTESSVQRKLAPTREQIWIMSSCKMAVKAGDPLSIPEMEKLIVDLATTENPYLCPHGRPITVTMGKDDLLKTFKRL
jgi:DNA mismatch repair protein MutL